MNDGKKEKEGALQNAIGYAWLFFSVPYLPLFFPGLYIGSSRIRINIELRRIPDATDVIALYLPNSAVASFSCRLCNFKIFIILIILLPTSFLPSFGFG